MRPGGDDPLGDALGDTASVRPETTVRAIVNQLAAVKKMLNRTP
jgi:hypothetical protein